MFCIPVALGTSLIEVCHKKECRQNTEIFIVFKEEFQEVFLLGCNTNCKYMNFVLIALLLGLWQNHALCCDLGWCQNSKGCQNTDISQSFQVLLLLHSDNNYKQDDWFVWSICLNIHCTFVGSTFRPCFSPYSLPR